MEMSNREDGSKISSILVPSIVAGMSLGWLVGLSASPVVGTVIGALLAIVSGLGAALTTFVKEKKNGSSQVNLWPLALLILGIAFGASCGLYVRAEGWFASSDPVRRGTPEGSGVLYEVSQSNCNEFQQAVHGGSGADQRRVLEQEFGAFGQTLSRLSIDNMTLRNVVTALCEK